MTVKALIEKLEQEDPNAVVRISVPPREPWFPPGQLTVGRIESESPKWNKIVFLCAEHPAPTA